MSDYIFSALVDRGNLLIIVFLFVFGGLVGMMHVTGGIKEFANVVKKAY
ncbi:MULTISPECIES: hypothetical protein [Bacillaceae]|nr:MULTISPECIES: hypothetical protein [Bacillaceae]MCM3164342.1 hypothetical protein [Metabacillus litoralis]UGB33716.1 hypothetical protein LPC09_26025 [Metabacillus sp. B2-18]